MEQYAFKIIRRKIKLDMGELFTNFKNSNKLIREFKRKTKRGIRRDHIVSIGKFLLTSANIRRLMIDKEESSIVRYTVSTGHWSNIIYISLFRENINDNKDSIQLSVKDSFNVVIRDFITDFPISKIPRNYIDITIDTIVPELKIIEELKDGKNKIGTKRYYTNIINNNIGYLHYKDLVNIFIGLIKYEFKYKYDSNNIVYYKGFTILEDSFKKL